MPGILSSVCYRFSGTYEIKVFAPAKTIAATLVRRLTLMSNTRRRRHRLAHQRLRHRPVVVSCAETSKALKKPRRVCHRYHRHSRT